MKKNSSTQIPLLVAGCVFLLLVAVFLSSVLLRVSNPTSIEPGAVPKTEIPTVTPLPMPKSIEEIKSDCSKGECLQACLQHADSEIQQSHVYAHEFVEDDVELVYYGISNGDELTNPRLLNVPTDLLPLQQNEAAHQMIWSYFQELVPREQRPNLVTLIIYLSSTSDGMFDTTSTDNWITYINILALEDAQTLSGVVVHEYGHYLTLNRNQRLSLNDTPFCRQEVLFGCPKPDSYVNLFYLEFWEDIYPEWKKIDWESNHYEKEIDLFYEKYEDRFLNPYAATDPIEDIAVSWEAFVLEPLPSGDSIAEQKIRFFNEFPNLVELRYQIIKGICTFENAQ